MSNFNVVKGDVVVLDYNDLVNKVDLSEQIEKAYGESGLGILTVSNIPGVEEARAALLPLAFKFAHLPEEIQAKYVHEKSFYSFGWSHGKEKLDGHYDLSKGSYYNNPQYDRPEDDEELIEKYSPFIHPNIWPTEDLPELEAAFKNLGNLIVSVGLLVAYQCDNYVKKQVDSYNPQHLSNIIATSKCCKARLLHYYARNAEENASKAAEDGNEHDPFSSWCGWHNDHGSLTGLTSAMFMNENGETIQNTDPDAGLFIRNRQSELVRVSFPANHLAFQIGETAQIHTGGVLQATPHAVRGTSVPGVSRESFAVFMEPMMFESMKGPDGRTLEQTQSQSAMNNLPKGVSPLKLRWNENMNFADFTEATLKSYY